jgi:uncharacterized damage-inducible protein DinB
MSDQKQLMVKLVLDAWNVHLARTGKLLEQLTDEQLQNEVAPGRNTGTYLLGHLVAVHDALSPLLGTGAKLYPQLEEPFIKQPDKSALEKPAVKELRNCWNEVNNKLSGELSKFSADEWLQKHTSVSEEDFAKEPHRNRLNVLISRTNHLAYHFGQLAFLKP